MATDFIDNLVTNDVIQAVHVNQFGSPVNHIEQGTTWYGAAGTPGGTTTDDYSVTVNSGATPSYPVTLAAGLMVHLKLPGVANTKPATLSVNGSTAKPVKRLDGQDVAAGALAANAIVILIYDGTNFLLLGDDPTQFALLAGRSTPQTLHGATGSAGSLTLKSTSHATKGHIYLGGSTIFDLDESAGLLGVGGAPQANIRLAVASAPTTNVSSTGMCSRLDPNFSTGSDITAQTMAATGILIAAGTDNVTAQMIGLYGQVSNNKTQGLVTAARGVSGVAQNINDSDAANLSGVAGSWQVTGTGDVTTRAAALQALAPSTTGSGAVAESCGLHVANQGASIVARAYGIRIANQTGAGAGAGDNWNLASEGSTSYNYLQGLVSIGHTGLPAARLHVSVPSVGSEVLRLASVTASGDHPNYFVRQFRTTTSNATTATLATITLTAHKTYHLEARVLARRTGGTAGAAEDGASYVLQATFQTTSGGSAALIGSVTVVHAGESQSGWNATLDANSTNARVRVTGAADNDIVWHATVLLQEVGE